MSRRARKNLKIAVVGANGRMGQAIVKLLRNERRVTRVLPIDEGGDWPNPIEVDAVIEFSSPAGLRQALDWCVKNRKPMVTGTTGLAAVDWKKIKSASRRTPILYSANMSLGVAVMKAMLRSFAAVPEWRFAMSETHHKKKKDKPSGTAKMLGRALLDALGQKSIKIVSHRRGTVAGIHEVTAKGPDETLFLSHTAHDRRVFARGAIAAALWLFDKGQPGLYDIGDLYQGR
jgi:4-hydroxy-tetrahydrodipicolinate reductase